MPEGQGGAWQTSASVQCIPHTERTNFGHEKKVVSLCDKVPTYALAYWFAGHSAQGPPGGPAKPVLHRQSVCASLAAGACECFAHAVQLTVLGASAYVFTGHIAKGPPSTP